MHFRILRLRTVDSTSECAFAALEAKTARDGDVFVAEAQTAGRGRLGRRWHSAPGAGLYASLVLLPREPLSPAGLTIAVGLSALDAVRALGLEHARLKWPNDVVVREARSRSEAKLAGVLVETRGLDALHPHYVAGVGINVTQREFPPELEAERAVTSLVRCGIEATVDRVLDVLLASLPARLAAIHDAPARLARDFTLAIGLGGARVRVVTGDETIVGRLSELEIGSGLAIECDDGSERRVPLEIVREIAAT